MCGIPTKQFISVFISSMQTAPSFREDRLSSSSFSPEGSKEFPHGVKQVKSGSHWPSGQVGEIKRVMVFFTPGDRGRSPDQHGHQNGGEFLTQSKALLTSKRGRSDTERQA